MGKGSKPRPVDTKTFNENFDKIFGKKIANRVKTKLIHKQKRDCS